MLPDHPREEREVLALRPGVGNELLAFLRLELVVFAGELRLCELALLRRFRGVVLGLGRPSKHLCDGRDEVHATPPMSRVEKRRRLKLL